MDDNTMIKLARKYLRQVGEYRSVYPSYEHLLRHCVDCYQWRKKIGLEQ